VERRGERLGRQESWQKTRNEGCIHQRRQRDCGIFVQQDPTLRVGWKLGQWNIAARRGEELALTRLVHRLRQAQGSVRPHFFFRSVTFLRRPPHWPRAANESRRHATHHHLGLPEGGDLERHNLVP